MLMPENLFGNFFRDERITPLNLYHFAEDVLLRLTRANSSGEFTSHVNLLNAGIDRFYTGLSRSGTTETIVAHRSLDAIHSNFKFMMKELVFVIADVLGGFKSAGYKAFYPNGIGEYVNGRKSQTILLMKRVSTLAVFYKEHLGADLQQRLSTFELQWQETIAFLTAEHTGLYQPELEELESTLLSLMHAIGQKYPGNLLMCMSFFNFSLLFMSSHEGEKASPANRKSLSPAANHL